MLTTSHVDSGSQMDGDISAVAVLTLTLALLLEEAAMEMLLVETARVMAMLLL